jgi:hypothetical protein
MHILERRHSILIMVSPNVWWEVKNGNEINNYKNLKTKNAKQK